MVLDDNTRARGSRGMLTSRNPRTPLSHAEEAPPEVFSCRSQAPRGSRAATD